MLFLFNPVTFLKLFLSPLIKSSSDFTNNYLILSGILAIDFAELLLNTIEPKKIENKIEMRIVKSNIHILIFLKINFSKFIISIKSYCYQLFCNIL